MYLIHVMYNDIFINLPVLVNGPIIYGTIASYHSGAHLIKPQFPVNLRTTLSQGCHISYNLVTTLPLYTRLLLGCYNLVRLSTGCDNLGISIWVSTRGY